MLKWLVRQWIELRDTFTAMRVLAGIGLHKCPDGHLWEATIGRYCPECEIVGRKAECITSRSTRT